MAGMYITDDTGRLDESRLIPAGSPEITTVPAGGFLLIWPDGDPGQGPLHFDFGLGRGGEEVALYDAVKNLIDYVAFGPQLEDQSRGRLPNGSGNWEDFEFGRPTPGTSNRLKPVLVMINEIMYHPYHGVNEGENLGEEYVELYNDGDESVDLAGWRFIDGVDFTFPDIVEIAAKGYLVIASDVNAFEAKYPGVTPVIGGWVGRLSNSGEEIELADGSGVIVDKVDYADQGDWAERLLGPVDHKHRGWTWSDDHDRNGESLELINPKVSNEHGQNWAASNTGRGTPGAINSAKGGDIAPLILDVEHSPIIPRANDPVIVTAQIIDELATGVTATLHHRIDGQPSFNTVTMFDDASNGDRTAGDGVYTGQIPAQADRAIVEFYVRTSDAGANIRTWPPPSTVNGTPEQITNVLYQVNDSYDPNAPWAPGSQPIYYIIMKATELTELTDIGDGNLDGDPPFASEAMSNAQMNATFISIDGVQTRVRYRVGVRNRGNRSRYDPPMCYRVNFAHDRAWKGVTALNINSQDTHLQLMGSVLFQLAGLPAPEAWAVQVRVNGNDQALSSGRMYGSYVALEVYDGRWAENHFPDDDEGNIYRCTYHDDDISPRTYAGLDYKSTMTEYRENYPKKTHASYDDYSDLLNLIDKLNNNSIPDANFIDEVAQVVNIEKWMQYLAADALMGNREGGLTDGRGDDFAMYRGIEDTRFWLLPHDLDTVLGQGDHDYRPQWDIFNYVTRNGGVNGLERLMDQPEVIKEYYGQYRKLVRRLFDPNKIYPVIDRMLGHWVSASEIEGNNGIKEFIAERIDSILKGGYPGASDDPQIPQEFTVDCDLAIVSGLHRTTGSLLAGGNIHGSANAIDTLSVTVNNRPADWTQKSGAWVFDDDIVLNPGINRIFVRAFDGAGGTGNEVHSGHIDIWCDDGNLSPISGTLAGNTILSAAAGPWRVTSNVTVPGGLTLTIEPGTTVYFDQDTRITVNGRLLAQGSEFQRIRLTRQPGSSATWDGLHISSTQDNRLSYADMEYSSADGESIRLSSSKMLIENVTWAGTTRTVLNISSSSVIVRNSVFPSTSSQTVSGHHLLGSDPYMLFEGNIFGVCTGTKQDVLDFSTSGSPVMPRFINNVFLGGGDDALDLDGTGAYVAGNIFMNFHRNFDPSEGESYGVTTYNRI